MELVLYGVPIKYGGENLGIFFPEKIISEEPLLVLHSYKVLNVPGFQEDARILTKDDFLEGMRGLQKIVEVQLGDAGLPGWFNFEEEQEENRTRQELMNTRKFLDYVLASLEAV